MSTSQDSLQRMATAAVKVAKQALVEGHGTINAEAVAYLAGALIVATAHTNSGATTIDNGLRKGE